MLDDLPAVVTLIPQPRHWADVRSVKAIPGMSQEERLTLKRSLHRQMDKYLDDTKLWNKQEDSAVKKLITQVCKECPFLSQRYEGAWPIEAVLRERLCSSAHLARRQTQVPGLGKGSSRRTSKNSRTVSKSSGKVSKSPVKANLLTKEDDEDVDMHDELSSSLPPESEEPMSPRPSPGPSQPRHGNVDELLPSAEPEETHTTVSHPGAGASQDFHEPAYPVMEPVSAIKEDIDVPPLPALDAVAVPEAAAGMEEDIVDPPLPAPVAAAAPEAAVAVEENIVDPPLPAPVAVAVPDAAVAVEEDIVDPPLPAPAAASHTDSVKVFLQSLIHPLDHLLLDFLDAGVNDGAALRSLAALPLEQQLGFLRTDLQMNLLQSRIVLAGLRSL